MALSSAQKKDLKRIGHHLKPIVIISEQGISEGVLAELDRALNDHELIKIRVTVSDRDAKQALINEACQQSGAELVQVPAAPYKNPNNYKKTPIFVFCV